MMTEQVDNIVIIGSSAGGTRILKQVFMRMPVLDASLIIVQHMPLFINESFRDSLDQITDLKVVLAENEQRLEKGKVYIAPSEYHLELIRNSEIHLYKGEKVNFVCPAVDVTMLSMKEIPSKNITGVILTGMGRDGAKGIAHIKAIGGKTIAQDEATSIVYGMPKEAVKTGAVDYILNPDQIQKKLINLYPPDKRFRLNVES